MMSAPNQPPLPRWVWIPFVVGALALVALSVSAVMPWFIGDFEHARYGPRVSVVLIAACTVLILVLMGKRSGWTWVPGLLVLAMAVMILIGVEEDVVCPTDVEIEGNIAAACFTEESTTGSVIFAAGAFSAALASFVFPTLARLGDRYAWTRRRSGHIAP